MEQSLFFQYIAKYFPALVLSITEKLNDKNGDRALAYLYRDLLAKNYSVDGRWQSLTGQYSRVAADVVAMDSSLPLKKRDSLYKATGDIPKMGMQLYLNEKQLSDIDAMIAMGTDINTIVQRIFEDTPRVIQGIYERVEGMFLEGLSTGMALSEPGDATLDTVGTGVRIDYGFMADHQFGVAVPWSGNATTATPLDDIRKMLDKAQLDDGNSVDVAYTDRATIDAMLATQQVRETFAFSIGYAITANTPIPIPSLDQANAAIRARYGFEFRMVDRAIRTERDGKQTTVRPWKAGMITFLPTGQIGGLVWTRLAEMNHPVSGVSYQSTDDYILVAKYRKNEPSLTEVTSSQARVVPVISNVDRIYQIDTTLVQA